jgi:hypothetical protein
VPLDTKLNVALTANQTSPLDLVSRSAPLSVGFRKSLTNGSGANQANLVWSDQRTIAASATDSLDLAGGSLTDAFGAALTFARIKVIMVTAAAGNTNNVNLTRPASNGVPLFLAAGDGIPVMPGGTVVWCAPNAAGVAVTAGTGDLIDLVNSGAGTSVTYDIVIIGASA